MPSTPTGTEPVAALYLYLHLDMFYPPQTVFLAVPVGHGVQ